MPPPISREAPERAHVEHRCLQVVEEESTRAIWYAPPSTAHNPDLVQTDPLQYDGNEVPDKDRTMALMILVVIIF